MVTCRESKSSRHLPHLAPIHAVTYRLLGRYGSNADLSSAYLQRGRRAGIGPYSSFSTGFPDHQIVQAAYHLHDTGAETAVFRSLDQFQKFLKIFSADKPVRRKVKLPILLASNLDYRTESIVCRSTSEYRPTTRRINRFAS